jgi:hypothetical protein
VIAATVFYRHSPTELVSLYRRFEFDPEDLLDPEGFDHRGSGEVIVYDTATDAVLTLRVCRSR